MAVQANSQQVLAYGSMLKSTADAGAELQAFLKSLQIGGDASAIGSRATTLDQALEAARSDNKRFLDSLSNPQKSGLKDITKQLGKADSQLAQQESDLHRKVADAESAGPDVASTAESLDHALTNFQNQQLSLGEKMGIADSNANPEVTFSLQPVKGSVTFGNQPIEITTSGTISGGPAQGGMNTFAVALTEDMSDLQQNMTGVLRAQLDKAPRCGERVAIQNATLTPLVGASLVVTRLHFEHWVCITVAGKETSSEMAEGNGTLEIKLTPAVDVGGDLRFAPEIRRVDAEGVVGDMLRTGALGAELRDKIAASVLSAVRTGGDFKGSLPEAARGYAALRRAKFQDTTSGKLTLLLDGDIRVSSESTASLTNELKTKTSAQASIPR
jgi:hypothetical protein